MEQMQSMASTIHMSKRRQSLDCHGDLKQTLARTEFLFPEVRDDGMLIEIKIP